MNKLTKMALTAILALTSFNAYALDFKGYEFGVTTPEEIEGCNTTKDENYPAYTCYVETIINGKQFHVLYSFMDNKLGDASMVIPISEYSTFLDAFKLKYKNLKYNQSTSSVSTAMGATFTQEENTWVDASGSVVFNKFGSKITESFISITTNEYTEFVNTYIKNNTKNLSDQL